jgi:hypothetical protein
MGLLKKKEDKPAFAIRARSGGASGSQLSPLRPSYVEKLPPCTNKCPSGNDIRGWLTIVAVREKLGLSLDQAYEQSWRIYAETNPFPAVMGRVCPHPCEGDCNRKEKEGAVNINAVERFIGDTPCAPPVSTARETRRRRSPWSAPVPPACPAPTSSPAAATR